MRLPSYRSTQHPARHLRVYEALRLAIPYVRTQDLAQLAFVSKKCLLLTQRALWQDPMAAIAALASSQSTAVDRFHQWWYSERDRQTVPSEEMASNFRYVNILDLSETCWRDLVEPIRLLSQTTEAAVSTQCLPNVKFLILPFRQNVPVDTGYIQLVMRPFELYLLSIPRAYNLRFFTNVLENSRNSLLFLDLANSTGSFVDALIALPVMGLPNVAVLNLRRFGLNSRRLGQVLTKLNARPFSLDISWNNLDDSALQTLEAYLSGAVCPINRKNPSWLDYEMPPPRYAREAGWQSNGEQTRHENSLDEDGDSRVEYRDDSIQGVMRFLTRHGCLDNHQCRSILEDLEEDQKHNELDADYALRTILSARTKLTHLYLGGNRFSDKQLCSTICGRGLQHLDLGELHPVTVVPQQTPLSPETFAFKPEINAGGFRLLGMLKHSHFSRLHHLRIHHFMTTSIPTLTKPKGTIITQKEIIHIAEAWLETHVSTLLPTPFDPEILPSLHTLALTCVPRKTFGSIIERIKHVLEKALLQEGYVDIARRESGSRMRAGPKIYSGLRVLRLEMAAEDAGYGDYQTNTGEDEDVRGFLDAVEGDFSFFDSEEQEQEPLQEQKMISKQAEAVRHADGTMDLADSRKLLDVCEEIRTYRKGPGKHWSGVIEVRY